MNSKQRRTQNRLMSRKNILFIERGGAISIYCWLSPLERRELARVAVVDNFGEGGMCYVRKTTA